MNAQRSFNDQRVGAGSNFRDIQDFIKEEWQDTSKEIFKALCMDLDEFDIDMHILE